MTGKPTYEELEQRVRELERAESEGLRAEETLRRSEERFNLAIEGTGAGLWDWEMDNDRVIYSKQWKKMLGYEDHEVEDSFAGWKKLWHPDDRERIEKAMEDYLSGKTAQYEIVHRLKHKDGHWRWILTRGGILKDRQADPTAGSAPISTSPNGNESKKHFGTTRNFFARCLTPPPTAFSSRTGNNDFSWSTRLPQAFTAYPWRKYWARRIWNWRKQAGCVVPI